MMKFHCLKILHPAQKDYQCICQYLFRRHFISSESNLWPSFTSVSHHTSFLHGLHRILLPRRTRVSPQHVSCVKHFEVAWGFAVLGVSVSAWVLSRVFQHIVHDGVVRHFLGSNNARASVEEIHPSDAIRNNPVTFYAPFVLLQGWPYRLPRHIRRQRMQLFTGLCAVASCSGTRCFSHTILEPGF